MSPVLPREARLIAAVLALLALALFGPPLAQAEHYHHFADQQWGWGLAHAADVLSNLPFALLAAAGAWRLRRAGAALSPAQRAMAWVTCTGLLMTAIGSAAYHLRPDDAGLVLDRAAMAVTFAGLLGLGACRVSERAGTALGLFLLVAAPAAVQVWARTGNLLPWAVVQGGGVLLLAVLAFTRPVPAALPIRWGLVLAAYALAKLLEWGDQAIWELTGNFVSGHSLKHLVAALAVLPVLAGWGSVDSRVQNARQLPVRAA